MEDEIKDKRADRKDVILLIEQKEQHNDDA